MTTRIARSSCTCSRAASRRALWYSSPPGGHGERQKRRQRNRFPEGSARRSPAIQIPHRLGVRLRVEATRRTLECRVERHVIVVNRVVAQPAARPRRPPTRPRERASRARRRRLASTTPNETRSSTCFPGLLGRSCRAPSVEVLGGLPATRRFAELRWICGCERPLLPKPLGTRGLAPGRPGAMSSSLRAWRREPCRASGRMSAGRGGPSGLPSPSGPGQTSSESLPWGSPSPAST